MTTLTRTETAYDRLVSALREYGQRVTESRDRATAQCPGHADRQASLSLRAVGDRVLVHCFAGCRTAEVLAPLGLAPRDLFDDTGQRWSRPWMPPRPRQAPPSDPGWTYVVEPPHNDYDWRRTVYLAQTIMVPVGRHPGGPVAPW